MAPRRAATAALTLALLAFPVSSNAVPAFSAGPEKGKSSARKLEWLAFDAAAEKAAKQNKHMIVDIYTNWCGWCRVMERETYGNAEVATYLTENFVLAKVNGESPSKLHWNGEELSERQFARKVGVSGYPATYFMKPNSELLGGVPGFIRPPDFMIYTKYVATRWYQRGKIQEYVDSLRASTAP